MKLSVTIITLNEEENIARCIDSVKGVADDIVIVDSGSTDKTVEIGEKMGARVFFNKFEDYAFQKNFAASKARNDWVFSLDADEIVEPQLAEEIKKAIKSNEYSAYSIPRKNIIFGKFIKFTRWQPELDRHVWLFRKSKGEWTGKVHEEFVARGKVGRLKNAKVHYQYENVGEFLTMMNKYSEIEAAQKIESGVKFSFIKLILDPLYNFLVRYFYRRGFLDGWRGYVLSCLMAIYHIELWIKVWEKSKIS